MLNGHDLNKGATVMVDGKPRTITHVSSMYLHVQDLMFYKTSGKPANMAATGLKIERIRTK